MSTTAVVSTSVPPGRVTVTVELASPDNAHFHQTYCSSTVEEMTAEPATCAQVLPLLSSVGAVGKVAVAPADVLADSWTSIRSLALTVAGTETVKVPAVVTVLEAVAFVR